MYVRWQREYETKCIRNLIEKCFVKWKETLIFGTRCFRARHCQWLVWGVIYLKMNVRDKTWFWSQVLNFSTINYSMWYMQLTSWKIIIQRRFSIASSSNGSKGKVSQLVQIIRGRGWIFRIGNADQLWRTYHISRE